MRWGIEYALLSIHGGHNETTRDVRGATHADVHLSLRICATSTAGAPAALMRGFECSAAATAACGVADATCPLLLPLVGPRFTASLATQTVCRRTAASW